MHFSTATTTALLAAIANAAPATPAAIKEACPAPGATNSRDQYGCNPAHSYPQGQTCKLTDGCYVLCNGQTTTGTNNKKTSCPAAGQTSADGRYSCNPAHTYPAGQTCTLQNGCYYLTTTASNNKKTSCPAAGTTTSDGKYSCNPAHSYPAGQKCTLQNGCYFLTGKSSTSNPSSSATYAIKGFTERKLNGKDISTVFFNISATNGGTLDFECSPYDQKTHKAVHAFKSGTTYDCSKNTKFSFSYSPSANGGKNVLTITNAGGAKKASGSTTFSAPICRAGGSNVNDLVCSVPEQERVKITLSTTTGTL